MVVDERLTAYLHSLDGDPDSFFKNLRSLADRENVPIIRRETERFLKTLLLLKKPERILEIGTGIAYSTLVFAEYGKQVKELITIENYPPRIEEAKTYIQKYLCEEKEKDRELSIELLEKDAKEAIAHVSGTFPFIFLDGPKAQYIVMLPVLKKLLSPGGILLADNVLQDGELIDSRYATPRRQRTIHERMREFIWEVMHDPQLETTLLTVGDGMTLSIRKEG